MQSVYEDVARDTNRGHTVRAVAESFHQSKDAGFKVVTPASWSPGLLQVVTHMMPDLPNVDLERDIHQFMEFFENPMFRPDGLKLYPTLVIRSAPGLAFTPAPAPALAPAPAPGRYACNRLLHGHHRHRRHHRYRARGHHPPRGRRTGEGQRQLLVWFFCFICVNLEVLTIQLKLYTFEPWSLPSCMVTSKNAAQMSDLNNVFTLKRLKN